MADRRARAVRNVTFAVVVALCAVAARAAPGPFAITRFLHPATTGCVLAHTGYARGYRYQWCAKSKKDDCREYQCQTCKPDGSWSEATRCEHKTDDKVLPDPDPKHDARP